MCPVQCKIPCISELEDLMDLDQGVLENCHFLQKLAVKNLSLNSDEIEQICQNGETLQILSLEGCNIDFYDRTELIQKLFTKCSKLTELNIRKGVGASIFGNSMLLDQHVCALVDNLTPNILKLSLCSQSVTDEHVNTLVRRCNKITELDLSFTEITKGLSIYGSLLMTSRLHRFGCFFVAPIFELRV